MCMYACKRRLSEIGIWIEINGGRQIEAYLLLFDVQE